MLFSVCFLSTPLLLLSCLILENRIHLFLLHVEKHNILVAMLKCRMIVSSPGGDMLARQVCSTVKNILRGVEFNANLMSLTLRVLM
jgi:hypothetical protein